MMEWNTKENNQSEYKTCEKCGINVYCVESNGTDGFIEYENSNVCNHCFIELGGDGDCPHVDERCDNCIYNR